MRFTGLISWIAYKEGIALMKMGVRIWFCMFLLAHCVPMTSCTSCQDTLLYTRYSSIMEFDVYTRRVTVLVDVGSSFVYGIDYDYKNRFIYFPRFNTHQIVRFAYPSKTITLQTVVQTDPYPTGIAVDTTNNHIYWANYIAQKLSRCNIDGSNVTVLSTLNHPFLIRLDFTNRWIYIVEQIKGILKSRFDFSELQTIVNFTSSFVECMDIDTEDERLYWINIDGDMKSSFYDGSDVKTILSTHVKTKYYAIYVFGSYIYYADVNNQLLMVKKTQGSTPIVLYDDTSVIGSIFVFNLAGIYLTLYNNLSR
ncbi:low-density lipoprotein receptor-related protein 5-like [Mytilus edulis]|uniref:low-density lipoprotein receptor-related protein 5-like n=1 Tax=Mytilus edulis TaxID=6550 RepID=UPI0039EE48D3